MTSALSMRNIVVVICAVILTIILIFLGEWINLHRTAAGEISLEQGPNLPGYYVESIRRKLGGDTDYILANSTTSACNRKSL